MKFFLIILIYLIILNFGEETNNNEFFLNWGLKNNLKLSKYIEVLTSDENKLIFKAKEDIPNNLDLIEIPYSIMFNITKILKTIKSKNLNNQYRKFLTIDIQYDFNRFNFEKDEVFLAYFFYLIQHESKIYKANKFFENYKNYWESIKNHPIKSPLFYNEEQGQLLSGTGLFLNGLILKLMFDEEITQLKNNLYDKRTINCHDFYHHRLVIHNNGLNIFNRWTLVPFLNNLEHDYSSFNAKYIIQKNGNVKIISTKEIKKGEKIILDSDKRNNLERVLIEGKTNEKLVDYYNNYEINAFSPLVLQKYSIDELYPFANYFINLKETDFILQARNIYIQLANLFNGEGTDIWAYSVLELDLSFYKDYFDNVNFKNVSQLFEDEEDRINVERILRGGKNIINKAILQFKDYINNDKTINLNIKDL